MTILVGIPRITERAGSASGCRSRNGCANLLSYPCNQTSGSTDPVGSTATIRMDWSGDVFFGIYKFFMRARASWLVALSAACLVARSDSGFLAEPAVVQANQVQPTTPPDPTQGVVYYLPHGPRRQVIRRGELPTLWHDPRGGRAGPGRVSS